MNHEDRAGLVELGLSPAEAQVYLTLVHNAGLSASAIAGATGFSRSSVYQLLCSMADKGLVKTGLGHGSKFAVVTPDQGLPLLVARERETILQRESLAEQLGHRLASLVREPENSTDEPLQVIRNRQVFADTFDRLQLEAERQVDIIVKAPILNPRKENPAQQKAQRRGIMFRCLYEQAALEDPDIKPYVEGWIAGGEEARVYVGELPYKLSVFDSEVVLLALNRPGDHLWQLLIGREQLAKSLSMLFEFLWERGEPIPPKKTKLASKIRVTGKRTDNAGRHTNRLPLATAQDNNNASAPTVTKLKQVNLRKTAASFRS